MSITYASDWATQDLGIFVDDVTLPDGTSDVVRGRPGRLDGLRAAARQRRRTANNWMRTDASGFPVGASITTPRSMLMGFGVEGISTRAERNAVMGRAMRHLLD